MLSSAAGILLGFLAKLLLGWLAQRQASADRETIGRITTERDQAAAGRDAAERMAEAAVNAPGRGEAQRRLNEGSA